MVHSSIQCQRHNSKSLPVYISSCVLQDPIFYVLGDQRRIWRSALLLGNPEEALAVGRGSSWYTPIPAENVPNLLINDNNLL